MDLHERGYLIDTLVGLAVLIFGILLSPRRRLQVQIKTLSS